MRIQLNGEPHDVPDGITIRALLDTLQLGSGPIAVEQNAVIVPRAQHASTLIIEHDSLEVVQFVGGG
jgi:sulfur carrier protein